MSALAPFVPTLAVELGRRPTPSWTCVEGSMLSADISGFTALSEKLAVKGKAGAEEITELVNRCFTVLIDAAHSFGGEILKFGGDALLVLFRGDDHGRRAVDAGLDMQRALHASAAAKSASLTMTVGVAEGPFDVFVAGSDYRELIVTGPRATEVIRLEGAAAKGDTLVSAGLAESLPPDMLVRSEADGWVVTGSTGLDRPGPRLRDLDDDDLGSFVPSAVREQYEAFAGLGGEHRLVTVGFLMVTGISRLIDDRGSEGVAAAFHDLVDEVDATCAEFGTTLLHTDIAPDGVKFVLCAGAPVNPGDTADAMLQAALRIAESETPFVLRQGVQTGRVFAGFLGTPYRRAYTLMGDPVNTAARMLGKAGDREVVAVGTVVDDTRTVFATDELEPFHVKGKTEPIVAHRVRGVSDRVRRGGTATRLFGRRDELDLLSRAIGELGEIVVITGVAGVGKSRLLDAAWDMAEGLDIFQGACTPYGSASPYSVFRPLLRGGAGIDIDADADTVGRHLTELVGRVAPDLLPMLPLLAIPFGATVAGTPEADSIEPEFRRARVHDVVLAFLDAVLSGPTFLVVEDLHWVDDASGELVNHLVRAAADRPWTGVFTRRPQGSWSLPPDAPNTIELHLEPMDDADIRDLAIEVAAHALSDAELTAIVERADGNPLFAVELARTIGVASIDGLPDSIEGVISTRIDHLTPGARHTIRLASVIGRRFDRQLLAAVGGRRADIGRDLGVFDGMIEPVDGGGFGFGHAMYRDVAYEGLPYSQRRRLHGRVADHLASSVDDPSSIADLLSLHFSAAHRHPQAWAYSLEAGEAARASFANLEAVELYQRALKAARYVRSITDEERAHVWEALGNTLELSGRYEEAFRAYQRQKQLSDDLDTRVRATRRQARTRQRLKNFTAAIRLLHAAETMLRDVRREPWVHRRLAEIHLNLSGIRMDQGHQYEARQEGELAEYHAAKAGDDALVVQALGAIVGGLTHWEEARDHLGAVELAASIGADEAESMLAQNLGMIAFYEGEWSQAVELYERGGTAARRIGNVTIATAAEMNAAEILVDQGRYGPARDILENACRVFRASHYESALLYAQLNLGTAMIRSGDRVTGHELLAGCVTGFHDGAMQLYAHEAELRIAESHLLAGEIGEARAVLATTLATAASLDRAAVIEARGRRLLAIAALHDDDRPTAGAEVAEAEQICRREHLSFELALTLLARHEADGADADEAFSILRRLGVVDVSFHPWARERLGADVPGATWS